MWTVSGVNGQTRTGRPRRVVTPPREEAQSFSAPPFVSAHREPPLADPIAHAPPVVLPAVATLDIQALRRLGYCVSLRPRRKGRRGGGRNGGRGGRPDPLGDFWRSDIVPILERAPDLRPCELLREVARLHPDRDFSPVRRTLERRVREWRESHA